MGQIWEEHIHNKLKELEKTILPKYRKESKEKIEKQKIDHALYEKEFKKRIKKAIKILTRITNETTRTLVFYREKGVRPLLKPNEKLRLILIHQLFGKNNRNMSYMLMLFSLMTGIDVGLESFATLSNGEKIENPKFFRKSENRLARLQKRLSEKKKGSKNRQKARLKVARQHEKIFNQRNDFLHNETAIIVRRFRVIAVEELNVNGMIINRHLAKSIADASWSRFVQMLSYKVEETGGRVELVNPRYTSQICSSCGHKQKMPLDKRVYKYENCGFEIDRDLNSAININTSGQGEIQAYEQDVRPLRIKATTG